MKARLGCARPGTGNGDKVSFWRTSGLSGGRWFTRASLSRCLWGSLQLCQPWEMGFVKEEVVSLSVPCRLALGGDSLAIVRLQLFPRQVGIILWENVVWTVV